MCGHATKPLKMLWRSAGTSVVIPSALEAVMQAVHDLLRVIEMQLWIFLQKGLCHHSEASC